MKVEYKVTELTHDDLVTFLSLEAGGWDYWGFISLSNDLYAEYKAKNNREYWEEVYADALMDGIGIEVNDVEDDDKTYHFNLPMLAHGIAQAIEEYPEYADIDEWDTTAGDIIMQYALFGDVIYG